MATKNIPLGTLFQKMTKPKAPTESPSEPLNIATSNPPSEGLSNESKGGSLLSEDNGLKLIESGKLNEASMLLVFSLSPSQKMAMALLLQAISLEGMLVIAESEEVTDLDAFWKTAVEKIDFGSLSDEEISTLAKCQHYAIFVEMLKTWKYSVEDTMELLKLCNFHPKALLTILDDTDLSVFFQAIHANGWEESITPSLISIFEDDSTSLRPDVLVDFAQHINTVPFWDFVARRVAES